MAEIWDLSRVEEYITQGIEESLTLDYKAAGSLAKTDSKKSEITKDVSAMANSAGGLIIYGIAEDATNKHLPGAIDPIDRNLISKEWLEQVISNIRPKIDGLVIHPISINTAQNQVVYVVEIPQSHTAHQATDKKYYKRFNFESVAMEDYEIRDVMGRGQYPQIELELEIEVTQDEVRTGGITYMAGMPLDSRRPTEVTIVNYFKLVIWAYNAGRIYAQYVNVILEIPDSLMPVEPEDEDLLIMMGGKRSTMERDGLLYYQHFDDNTTRDIIGFDRTGFGGARINYGPARYVPILPGRYHRLGDIDLRSDFDTVSLENLYIEWKVFADNAPTRNGKIAVSDIKLVYKRHNAE